MNTDNISSGEPKEELPDNWWHKVYAAVIVTTVAVIALLWAFSRYFSD